MNCWAKIVLCATIALGAMSFDIAPAAADGFHRSRPYVKKRFYRAWNCRCRTLAEIYRTPAQDFSAYYYNSHRRYARLRIYK